jgi:nicotinamide-nucleotide amidase
MELELVTIGNELLLGFTLDTNTAELATALNAVGVRLVRSTTVGDAPDAIRDAVRDALARTGFVVTTGGLGPTRDDVTKKVVADLFDAPLDLDVEYLEELRRRFERLGRGPMSEKNRSQAEIPRGAVALQNPRGTAPGVWLEGSPGVVVMLPGVPHEMRGLLETELVPRLVRRMAGSEATVTRSRLLRTTGIAESSLADELEGVDERIAPVTLAYLPSLEGVDLRLTSWHMAAAAADAALEDAVQAILPLLGRRYYAEADADLAAVVLDGLGTAGHRLATAESCTGGLLGERITAIEGSSAVYVGGVVAYANEVKAGVLKVSPDILERHGAVSEEVARAMARGVAERLGVSAAMAVTGVAGPGGGTPDKPVGTVYVAARLGDADRVVRLGLSGDRDTVRRRSAQAALDLLRGLLARSAGAEDPSLAD